MFFCRYSFQDSLDFILKLQTSRLDLYKIKVNRIDIATDIHSCDPNQVFPLQAFGLIHSMPWNKRNTAFGGDELLNRDSLSYRGNDLHLKIYNKILEISDQSNPNYSQTKEQYYKELYSSFEKVTRVELTLRGEHCHIISKLLADKWFCSETEIITAILTDFSSKKNKDNEYVPKRAIYLRKKDSKDKRKDRHILEPNWQLIFALKGITWNDVSIIRKKDLVFIPKNRSLRHSSSALAELLALGETTEQEILDLIRMNRAKYDSGDKKTSKEKSLESEICFRLSQNKKAA